MAVTKGRRWEILHSLWVGWTFTLSLFNWVAFLYIGFRTRQWKWMLWALFYSAPLVTVIVSDRSIGPPANQPTWLMTATIFLFLGLGVVSIFHAFRVRKELHKAPSAKTRGLYFVAFCRYLSSGRCWVRTSDLCRVKAALSGVSVST